MSRRFTQTDDEMDITPMIDITFLLLIFFLVASTPDRQTAVDLPEARFGRGVSQHQAVVITVGATGRDQAPIYLADGKIEANRISGTNEAQAQQIREAIERESSKSDVIIKGDRSVPCREIDRVIKAASQVPGTRIHLAVLETE